MKEAWSRLRPAIGGRATVRRSLLFFCGREGLRDNITRIGRHYGLLNARGGPLDAEIVRLLLVTALTSGTSNRVQTAVDIAVAVQKPMLAAGLGRRIAIEYSTGRSKAVVGRAGPGERKNRARVVLDDWLSAALNSLAPRYRDDTGRVHDGKLVADLCMAAVRDSDLHAILSRYVQRMRLMRERLEQAEVWVRQVVAEAMSEEQRRAG